MFVKALVLSALASVAFATECARTYTVKEGDWCDKISAANNASTYQLSTVNADKINDACTNLEIGQPLCLGNKGEDCQTTYVVKAGDTCDKIMYAQNINATMLWANNPQIDEYCSNIYIGEVLATCNQYVAPQEVPERQIGQPGGTPAGPPAPAPYPEAQQQQQQKKEKSPESTTPETTPETTTPETSVPAAAKQSSSTPDYSAPAATPEYEDDDSNLPECEDPNDDGYAY